MNKFGLDTDYFKKEFKILNDKLEFMRPAEMMGYMKAFFDIAERMGEDKKDKENFIKFIL